MTRRIFKKRFARLVALYPPAGVLTPLRWGRSYKLVWRGAILENLPILKVLSFASRWVRRPAWARGKEFPT